MQTNWPKGAALPRPRRSRKRPEGSHAPGRREREARRMVLAFRQVERKLCHGVKHNPTVPKRADSRAVALIEACEACGRDRAPADAKGKRPPCAYCAAVKAHMVKLADGRTVEAEASPLRRIQAQPDPAQLHPTEGARVAAEYRPLIAPSQADPNLRAGDKLRRAVATGKVRAGINLF